jgi:hypothetical protein
VKKAKFQLNSWCFRLALRPEYWSREGYVFEFGIFKITQYPPEAEELSKEDYKGFWFKKYFNLKWKGFEIHIQ